MLSTETIPIRSRQPRRTPPAATSPDRSNALQPTDEQELIQGLLADDEASWRRFNDEYSRLIYRCITRVTARFSAVIGPEDVREVYAMLFVQLLANDKKKLRSFEPDRGSRFSSWIGMLAIHIAYDYLRGLKREPKRGCLSEAECIATDSPDPHDVCVVRERARLVGQLLGGFSTKDREFISLYFGQGLEPDVIAKRMGISVKTVYSKKHKIRTRLEAMLAERKLAA